MKLAAIESNVGYGTVAGGLTSSSLPTATVLNVRYAVQVPWLLCLSRHPLVRRAGSASPNCSARQHACAAASSLYLALRPCKDTDDAACAYQLSEAQKRSRLTPCCQAPTRNPRCHDA